MNNKSKFQTLVFFDLETTGLVYDKPKITELAMIAVHISTLDEMESDEEFPRILNKFIKFFNPEKPIHSKAMELSNLNNHMLMNYAPFNRETINAIENFLNDFPKPLCFVAHNGNIFDFPIFFNEIQTILNINDTKENLTNQTNNSSLLLSIDCVDSMNFFREIYRLLKDDENENEYNNISIDSSLSTNSIIHRGYVEIPIKSNQQSPSLKLVKIYEREFNRISNLKSHRAEDDCLMLLAILKRYLPDWFEWIDNNHRPLSDFSFLPTTTTTKFSPKNNIKVKRPLKF